MSAIAGIFNINGEPVSIEHSNGMMKSLEKYPADDVQTWRNGNVFFGCHAQWITPESMGEKLPYYDYERKLAITADAIIDNRDELFDKLNIPTNKRQTMSDSELILLSYERWGEESPKYLIGDFAYMIWDEREQKMFGARDFSGMRTLYFFSDGNRFVFCTAMLPLFSINYIRKQLNERWLAEYLAIPDMLDSIDVFSTVYQNIEQLPPSHSITISNDGVKYSRYSYLFNQTKLKLKTSDEYVEAFQEVFKSAVDARLRTYKNVGAHLSGGLDSGSVVAFAAKSMSKSNKTLHTYSYVPEDNFVDWTSKDKLADERPYIESIVNYVGNINENYLDFKGKNSFTEIDYWLETMEMPYKFFENSFWLRGIYERANQDGIGVLLSGQRGNFTISWGPTLDYYAQLLKRFRLIKFHNELNLYLQNTGARKSRLKPVIRKKAFPYFYRKSLLEKIYRLPAIVNPELLSKYNVYSRLNESGVDFFGATITDIYETRKKHFEKIFFWNGTGTVSSKLSLDYSLWNRDPTNDLRIVRFCLSLPEEQYVNNGYGRALIRRSTENLLPDKVRLNQRYRGIQGAETVSRMTHKWDEFVIELEQLISNPDMAELLDLNVIKESISRIRKTGPRPEDAFSDDFRILMRSLIVYRFIRTSIERG